MRASRIEGVGGGKGMSFGSGRSASSAKGSSKKPVKQALKNAKKAKPLAEPKSAVKVKTAAKQLPGKKDMMTIIKKRAFRNEQIASKEKGNDFINSGISQAGPYSRGKSKLWRQVKASNKKK